MFCNNCGNEVKNGEIYCQNCGTYVGSAAAPTTENTQAEIPAGKGKKSRTILILVALVAVAIVAIVLIFSLFGGGGYKKAAKGFMNAFEKANGKKIVKLVLPKDLQKGLFEEFDVSKDEFIEEMEDSLNDIWEELEDEGGKFTSKIKKAENLDDLNKLEEDVDYEFGYSDLDDFIDDMDYYYGDYDFDADKIKDAYAVEIKMVVTYDDEKETETMLMIVYKYKGSWYVDMNSVSYYMY